MRKILIAACAATLVLGSTATMASGNLESELTPVSAEDILNWRACRDKKPTDTIKSHSQTKDGKIIRVKCAKANKIVADAKIPVVD